MIKEEQSRTIDQRGRASKVLTLDEAVEWIEPGAHLCLGGFSFHNRPSAFVRALARRRIGELVLSSAPSSGYDADLLIGAGLVRRTLLASVSFEHLGMAPNFRRAAEEGRIELVECEEATIVGGLMAAAENLPYHPVASLRGSAIADVSPLASRTLDLDGQPLYLVPALRPDVAVLHAQQADAYGNVRMLGGVFCDRLIAKAARRVIVTVDEIVPPDVIAAEPWRTTLPGYLVDAVVEVPYGAHPASSHGRYLHDEEHLRLYLAAAEATRRDPQSAAFAEYLRIYVDEPSSHLAYLERVGGLKRLLALRQDSGA